MKASSIPGPVQMLPLLFVFLLCLQWVVGDDAARLARHHSSAATSQVLSQLLVRHKFALRDSGGSCITGWYACPNFPNVCAPDGSYCCSATGTCLDNATCFGIDQCCPNNAKICGGTTCCNSGSTCCSGGTSCCDSGYFCCNDFIGGCCPDGFSCTSGSDTCTGGGSGTSSSSSAVPRFNPTSLSVAKTAGLATAVGIIALGGSVF